MAFAEDMAEVKAAIKLPAVAEALGDSSEKVLTALHSMTSDFTIYAEDVLGLMKKKEKIQALGVELDTIKAQNEDLTGKADTSKLTEELEVLRGFKKTTMEKMTESFQSEFAIIADHSLFDNAKKFLKLPATDDDGKFVMVDGKHDFTKVSTEDMEANAAELSKLNALNYFADKGKTNTNTGDPSQRKKSPPSTENEKLRGARNAKEAMDMLDD